MIEYDLIIIGGGAAGLFAAARAAESGLRICLLEGMNQCGLKLLVSGSGQCNLTNAEDIRSFPERFGPAGSFVKPSLFEWSNSDLVGYLEERGLPCEDRGDGKIFPVSRKSRDLRDLLQKICQKAGGEIFWKSPVTSILREEVGFTVRSKGKEFSAARVLLATGGKSYPGTGSTGGGYALAEGLGHTVAAPVPALTPVLVRNFALASCSGTSLEVSIDLYRSGKKAGSYQGDLLITHRGFSGPVILNNSRDMAAGDELRICWCPGWDRQDLDRDILETVSESGKKSLKSGLAVRGITDALMQELIRRAGLDPSERVNQLSRKERNSWVNVLFSSSFTVQGMGGFNQAMVTSGGISLKEVNPRTMESRICGGLFMAGEVLDVDGETGGYNLQFAFSSAALAVKTMTAE
ncbi:MAG: NAD(P)/FAD-dependent oxidoreductase [Spirochaetales bacterium]|nr:NAD(P)/FAD-dependent oxidoreductase [Spirochaetales bacterium]